MSYSIDEAVALLERTPRILRSWLAGLPEPWLMATEGPGTWNAFDVIGHLIHGERTDWISRMEHILTKGESEPFPVFDREAMFAASEGKSLGVLLETFAELREENLVRLRARQLTAADLDRTGRHPEFGTVTLRQHLATWVAHDLTHIVQIARVMANRYGAEVGPWKAYLSVLRG